MKLTVKKIESLKAKSKTYKVSDGSGLHIQVNPTGSKLWRSSYRFEGKQKTLALGSYPELTLLEARNKNTTAKLQLKDNIDPSLVKKKTKTVTFGLDAKSFELVATEWFKVKIDDKSKKHQERTWRALERDFFPYIGDKSVDKITSVEVLTCLRRIEERGTLDTARRSWATAKRVFNYAISTGRAKHNPASSLNEVLEDKPKAKHYAAITEAPELSKLLLAIDAYEGTDTVKNALKLLPQLLLRPGELQKLEWSEVDFEKARIEIHESKMKEDRPHIVPLSNQVLEILRKQKNISGKYQYVFPSIRSKRRPITDCTLNVALKTMGYPSKVVVPHGFRATARTMLDENLEFRVDFIEHQLSHLVRDSNGRAYNRTKFLTGRKEMLQAWSDYLCGLKRNPPSADE